MSLTPEERQRIYEEEKERMEVRRRLEQGTVPPFGFAGAEPASPIVAERSVSNLAIVVILLVAFAGIGSMWWLMVGSLPHTPTNAELLQQAQENSAKAQQNLAVAAEVSTLVFEYDNLHRLPNPTLAQLQRMKYLIERIDTLNPSLVVHSPPK